MKIVCYNQKMLDIAIDDMYNKLSEYGSLSLEYNKPFRDVTIRQLGFFWGALIDSIHTFLLDKGNEYTPDEIKENLYQAVSPKVKITQFNGKVYEVPKRISEMSLEEMSDFIDKTIWLCDNARAFKGLILHPSIRHTWIRHITKDDLRNLDISRFPVRCSEYLEYSRKQACICCGRFNGVEAHHLKEVGFSGMATKSPDYLSCSLCSFCHREYHQKGKDEFMKNLKWITKYISITDFCLVNFSKWFNHK